MGVCLIGCLVSHPLIFFLSQSLPFVSGPSFQTIPPFSSRFPFHPFSFCFFIQSPDCLLETCFSPSRSLIILDYFNVFSESTVISSTASRLRPRVVFFSMLLILLILFFSAVLSAVQYNDQSRPSLASLTLAPLSFRHLCSEGCSPLFSLWVSESSSPALSFLSPPLPVDWLSPVPRPPLTVRSAILRITPGFLFS